MGYPQMDGLQQKLPLKCMKGTSISGNSQIKVRQVHHLQAKELRVHFCHGFRWYRSWQSNLAGSVGMLVCRTSPSSNAISLKMLNKNI